MSFNLRCSLSVLQRLEFDDDMDRCIVQKGNFKGFGYHAVKSFTYTFNLQCLEQFDIWKKKIKKPAGIGCFCLLAILAVSLIYLLLQIALSHQLLLPHIGLLLRLPSPHPQSTPHPHHPPCPHYHEQAVCWSLRGGERQSD